jgi:hypothetical protein
MDSPLIAAAVLHSGRPRTRGEVVVRDSWLKRLQILASQLVEWARK